jgi:hypothetical protein
MTQSMQKLEFMSPYAHPLCTVTCQGVKLKSPLFEMFILFWFFFLSQVNVVRIIKLSSFKIIIIQIHAPNIWTHRNVKNLAYYMILWTF